MSPELNCRKDKSVDRMGSSGPLVGSGNPAGKHGNETAGGRASGSTPRKAVVRGAGDASAPAGSPLLCSSVESFALSMTMTNNRAHPPH
jgi:hypothetical protein